MRSIIVYILLIIGCTSTIEQTNDSYLIYDSILFDYSQFEQEIFIQVQINEDIIDQVDSVNVIIYEIIDQSEELIFAELKLSDDGSLNGDLIPNNGVYTFLGDLILNYTNYLINYKFYINGEIYELNETESIIESIEPSIVSIDYYKTTINDQTIQLENNNYSVDETDSSYFKFIVEVESPSGIEQINKIIYSISVDDIDATKCGSPYELDNFIVNEFILEYNNSIGDSHFYTNINSKFEEPGMTIGSVVGYIDDNSIWHCAILGEATFNIIIVDKNFGKVNSSHQINFVPCGAGFWDCANESESCIEECE